MVHSRTNTNKVIGISWVRNEEDILESFVLHNMAFLSQIIIVLHQCTDRSQSILEALAEKGVPLDIRYSNIEYHAQGEVLTSIMQELAQTQPCDWILPLDADEFLCSTLPVHTALRNTQSDRVYLLPWKTYVPTRQGAQTEPDIRKRITQRRATEPRQFYKVLIPSTHACNCILPMGSHELLHSDGTPVPAAVHPALWLAHMPVRSQTQLRNKICKGWEAHCSHPQASPKQSVHWKHLYNRCSDSTPISDEELQHIAMYYATQDNEDAVTLIDDPIVSTPSLLESLS